jgi:protein-S-isoprenylcysteine O-methyltransferase Ste14
MSKFAVLMFGVVSYFVFFATFLYAIGFVGNVFVPKSIDSGTDTNIASALLVNVILLTIFALQHSVMARPEFKRHWTKIVPQPVERSVFVLFASLALILVFWQWRSMTGVIWSVENSFGRIVLWLIFAIGWLTVLLSTFMINHFELFGLRQVYRNSRGMDDSEMSFQTRAFYRFVRHPIMLGFIIAFWATPDMTTGHLLFAAVTTVYILVALQLEERDLIDHHGETYRDYQRKVSMLLPLPRKG